MKNRPLYEATDSKGFPYMREAREVHELPHLDRLAALQEATTKIEHMLGLKASRRIQFGTPVFESFMRRPEAAKHANRALLMTHGCYLSLDLCPTYN